MIPEAFASKLLFRQLLRNDDLHFDESARLRADSGLPPCGRLDPGSETAVSVTCESLGYEDQQDDPQLIPLGLEVTVPRPLPLAITESVNVSVTVSVVLALVPAPSVTVIFVTPRLPPLASPEASMLATVGTLLVHVRPVPVTLTASGDVVVLPLPSWP